MKLLLNSLNYAPELTGIGKYNGEMCQALTERDVEVIAVVAPPYYPEWKIATGYRKFWFNTEFVNKVKLIRCPLYVPSKVTTIKRLIHLTSFAFSSAIALFSRLFKKPDVVVLVQPTLLCAPAVLLFCKLTGVKSVMHIQDYEIDALFGLGMIDEGRVATIAKKVEKWLLRRFDAVSTISYSMIENAKDKGVDESKLIHFPNWSDTDFVTPDTDGSQLRELWDFSPDDKIVLYAGNIGNKQGLEIVLEAAKSFEDQPEVKFVLVGAGAYVETLKSMYEKMVLTNVWFRPLQPWELVPQMLALADIHLVIQKKGAADAVLPSKLTNILSVGGHAIVTAEPHTELGRIAEQHPNIYHCIEPENSNELVNKLNECLALDTSATNQVAREFALQFLNKDKIIDQFVDDLSALTTLNRNLEKELT